jgi:hypothetical protein
MEDSDIQEDAIVSNFTMVIALIFVTIVMVGLFLKIVFY